MVKIPVYFEALYVTILEYGTRLKISKNMRFQTQRPRDSNTFKTH